MFTNLSIFVQFPCVTRVLFIPVFMLLSTASVTAQPMADAPIVVPSNIISECQVVVPTGQYILAESFFENYDYVVRRVAFLQAYGFENATYVHTRCQSFDVDKELYIVVITGPTATKPELYIETRKAYEHAVSKDIKLINTRIVQAIH